VFAGTQLVCTVNPDFPFSNEMAARIADLPALLNAEAVEDLGKQIADLSAEVEKLEKEIDRLEVALLDA
jgi:uncharacterized protein Yka (UPF0111/DUF47 family)